MGKTILAGGFEDPARDAAHAFRLAMSAMARPGTSHLMSGAVPPAPLSTAAGTLILTLCDPETPICLAGGLNCDDVKHWIAFHTGAPFASAADCSFAVGNWADLQPLGQYPVGRADYPDRSVTVIIETAQTALTPHRITGPGIEEAAKIHLPDTAEFVRNAGLFPLGLDFFFTKNDMLTALPRSTMVKPLIPEKEQA